jgi:hypothetical protein
LLLGRSRHLYILPKNNNQLQLLTHLTVAIHRYYQHHRRF